MSVYHIPKMQKKLKKYIDDDRYEHTMGVMYTAAALAMCWGEDVERAQVAGLLHDCAKCMPNSQKLKLCRQKGIPVSDAERESPYLLHASIGAYLAREKYHVEDPEILSAIACHTTGKPAMTRLEKLLYLADYIEPQRTRAANLPEIRRMAFRDLDRAVYMTLRDTLLYLKSEKACLDNQTALAYNYYENTVNGQTERTL